LTDDFLPEHNQSLDSEANRIVLISLSLASFAF